MTYDVFTICGIERVVILYKPSLKQKIALLDFATLSQESAVELLHARYSALIRCVICRARHGLHAGGPVHAGQDRRVAVRQALVRRRTAAA